MQNTISLKTRVLNRIRKVFTFQPFEKVLLFFVRGASYPGFRLRFIPNPLLYPFHSMRKVRRKGINYELDMSCLMQWYVYWDFNARDRDKLYSLVKTGDVVFDVGTNIGETLLNFAKLTGENGFVYGFEPDEENYGNVQKNIALNGFKNVKVFKLAVSDKKEAVKLFVVEPHNRGMNRILTNTKEEGLDFTTMEANTLDNVIEESKIEKLNLIKIDIEGYEMHALRGAIQTLKRFKPALFVEVGYLRLLENKTSPTELVKYLIDLGYKILQADTGKEITEKYDFTHIGEGSIDICAIHSSAAPR